MEISDSPFQNIMDNREIQNQMQAQHSKLELVKKKDFDSVKNALHQNICDIQKKKMLESQQFQQAKQQNEDDIQCNISFQCVQDMSKKIISSEPYFYTNLGILIIFFICCLIWDPKKSEQISSIAETIEVVCHCIFLFFWLLKTIEWKTEKMFWIFFDLLLAITGIISCSITETQPLRYLKAFRTLRLIFLIKEIKFLNEPTSNLITALAKVGNVLIPALLIIYIYAIVGLYSFVDFQFNRCRNGSNKNRTEKWTVYTEEVFLCGERKCPTHENSQLQCLNPINYGVVPVQNEVVNIIQGNGLLRYSNIFYSFLSTLKQTFVTGSSRLIVLYKQVLNPFFVLLYYYSYIYLISYIYLNIFYSLIIIAEWDKEEEEEMNFRKIKQDYGLQTQKNSDQRVSSVFERKISLENSQRLAKQVKIGENKELKKTKIHNIFENVQDQPEISNSSQVPLEKRESVEESVEESNIALEEKNENFLCFLNGFSSVVIVLTCINLSIDYHGQQKNFEYIVSVLDFVFYFLFVIEVIVKVVYYKKNNEKFQIVEIIDFIILFLCSVGIIYESLEANNLYDFINSSNWIQKLFRCFKYLRIFTIILKIPFFKEARLILKSTFKAIYSIKNVVVLWFLIVLIISIMGFHLHSYKTKVDQNGKLDMKNGKEFQVSMDGIFNSVIFTMLTFFNEEWDYLMFEQYLGSGVLIVIWQLVSLIVGLILFSKYFMALLMMQLETLMKNEDLEDENEKISDDLVIENFSMKEKSDSQEQSDKAKNQSLKVVPEREAKKTKIMKQVSFNLQPEVLKTKKKKTKIQQIQVEQEQEQVRRTICLKKCTQILQKIIENKYFSYFKMLFIIGSCTFLINTHPQIDRNKEEIRPYFIINTICFAFFLMELAINLIVYGLFTAPTSYLRRSWLNWLNICIIIIEILSFTNLVQQTAFLKIERLKVFRILYFVERRYKNDWNMRMTFHAFIQLLPKVFSLLAITVLFYMYFALILVKIYKDDFYYCSNYYSEAEILTKNDCLNWGGDWIQRKMNVANVFNSTLFLFLVATTEGWINLMTPMMNLSGANKEPSYNENQYICIFFAFFFFFGNLILLNVFIGLSVSNFKRIKQKVTGQSKLSKQQKMWLIIKEQIYRLQPLVLEKTPTNIVREKAYEISTSKIYKIIKGIFFLSFMIAMSFYKSNMTKEEKGILDKVQYGFVAILLLEEFIELLAFGIRKDRIKVTIFKYLAVFYCVIYIALKQTVSINTYDNRILGAVFIALQFCRYLLLLNEITFARKLLNSLATILPRTSNILLLISITLFIYAIIGMELFSYLKFSTELDAYDQNYTDFGSALFALIKFSTMESPIQQIIDAAQTCSPNSICMEIFTYDEFLLYGQNGCGSKISSYIFFISFHIFYSLVLMSTLMAVIVDSYSQVKKEENAFITKFVLEKVQNQWSKIDPQALGFIPYRQFWMFTAKLLNIYMGESKNQQKDMKKLFSSKEQLLNQMAIPIYENEDGILCFQFHEVIEALTKIYIKNKINLQINEKKTQIMFKERQSNNNTFNFKKSYYTSSHVSTLIVLKSGLRWWKNRVTNDTCPLEYTLVMKNFSKNKNTLIIKNE